MTKLESFGYKKEGTFMAQTDYNMNDDDDNDDGDNDDNDKEGFKGSLYIYVCNTKQYNSLSKKIGEHGCKEQSLICYGQSNLNNSKFTLEIKEKDLYYFVLGYCPKKSKNKISIEIEVYLEGSSINKKKFIFIFIFSF